MLARWAKSDPPDSLISGEQFRPGDIMFSRTVDERENNGDNQTILI